MRVLLIGPAWDTGQWVEYCAAGLVGIGHDVVMHRYSAGLGRPAGPWARLQRRIVGSDRFHMQRVLDVLRRDNLDVLKVAAQHRPELTVVLKGEVLLPETIERIGYMTDGPMVHWSGDDPTWFPNIVAAAHLYDRFFLADPSYAQHLETRNVTAQFLPHAADPSIWVGDDAGSDTVDVIFVGDARHNMGHLPEDRYRVDIVEAIAQADVSLAVWGRGWEKLEANYKVGSVHRGLTLLPAAAVARAYRGAKIALNVHHAQMREAPNMRTFEIPLAGAFQLTDYKSRMAELFDIGTELAVYKASDDLLTLIDRYLGDPQARHDIAVAGRRRVERDHTYEVRMRQLVEAALGKE